MIESLTKLTLTDYPDHLACIIWFSGCNMRCQYCYNPHIAEGKGKITSEQIKDFLNTRIDKLQGVVFSGGECTENKDFVDLLQYSKMLGFKNKVDTNGSNPSVIEENLHLIDYVALDFKSTFFKFKEITKSNHYNNFIRTFNVLKNNNVQFEVRTTVHPDLLDENDLTEMAKVLEYLGYKNTWYIQKYMHVDNFGAPQPSRKIDFHKIKTNLQIGLRDT